MAGEGIAVEFCVRDVRQGTSGGSYVVSVGKRDGRGADLRARG